MLKGVSHVTSEFNLIARYFTRPTPQSILGPGDDCALLMLSPGMELAITTDMLVSGTHFFADTDPCQLGWKTLAVNLSDLAAMGAHPRWILLAGSLPDANEEWISSFVDGLFACAKRYNVDLIGGDTTRGPLNLCVTALGEVPSGRALRRDHGQADDDLWVSGQPGLAALGLAQLQNKTQLPTTLASRCISALQRPVPRVELGMSLREQHLAHAAIDLSDGLLADIGQIVKRSRIDAEIYQTHLPWLPPGAENALARHCQLAGGDDYELAFSAPPSKRHELAELAARIDLPLWRIGRLVDGKGEVRLIDETGQIMTTIYKGFDHFAQDHQ